VVEGESTWGKTGWEIKLKRVFKTIRGGRGKLMIMFFMSKRKEMFRTEFYWKSGNWLGKGEDGKTGISWGQRMRCPGPQKQRRCAAGEDERQQQTTRSIKI